MTEPQLELISPPMTTVDRDETLPLAVIVSCCHGKRYRICSVLLPRHAEHSRVTIEAWMPLEIVPVVGGWTDPLVLPARFGVPTTIAALTALAYRIMTECGDHA